MKKALTATIGFLMLNSAVAVGKKPETAGGGTVAGTATAAPIVSTTTDVNRGKRFHLVSEDDVINGKQMIIFIRRGNEKLKAAYEKRFGEKLGNHDSALVFLNENGVATWKQKGGRFWQQFQEMVNMRQLLVETLFHTTTQGMKHCSRSRYRIYPLDMCWMSL